MGNGTRSSSRKAMDDENNDLKGSQNNVKKSVNLGAAIAEASGVRRSPRETLTKKNMTPPSSGTRKSERLEKQTFNLNSMTPPAKRKTERLEMKGKKNASPLRRSERGKMSSSSASGSKRDHKSLNVLNTKRKKVKKNKCVKQLTMQTVEVNEIEQEDEQAEEIQLKRMTACSYGALFTKQPKKVDGTDHYSGLNGTDSGRREEDILAEFIERTREKTTVTSTSQFTEEELKRNDEHELLSTSQNNNCKNMSFDGVDPQMSQNVLVAGEMNNDAETIDSGASPKMSINDIGTCTGVGTSLSSGCKRKDCTETCGMCSKRQRVVCNSAKLRVCSSNMKLNQFFESSNVMIIDVSDGNDHPSPKIVLKEGKLTAGDREGTSVTSASRSDKIHATSSSLHEANNISKTPDLKMVEWERRRKQRESQKNLHVLLRPQIAKLCEILHLTEDVKAMVERFLEYVMDNHMVHREPATILQAFQISLCWSAASLLKQKLDHKESLALAKQHLGFTCKKEEADYVYSLLRCLKRMFLYRTGYLKFPNSPKASGLSSKAVETDYSNATPYQQNIKAKVEDLSCFQEGSDIQTISESGVAPEIQLALRDLIKSIKEIQKKCDKLMKKQTEKNKQEMEQFIQKYEEEKAQLENKKRRKEAVIRLHSNLSMRTDKLKSLDTEYARKFDELERQMDIHLKDLEALQVASRTNIQGRKTRWVESVESWARVELVKSPVSETNLSEGRSSGIFQSASGSEVRPSKIVHIVDDEAMAYRNLINKAEPLKENTSEGASVECNLTANSGCVEEQAVSRDSCSREQDSVDEIPKGGVLEDVLSLRCSDEEQISDGSKAITSDLETVSLTDALENLVSMEAPSLLAPSSEKVSDKSTLRKVDGEILRESVTIISSEGRENFVPLEVSSSVAIHDESDLSKVDGPVPLKEPVVANSGEDQGKLVSAEVLSSEKIPNGAALNNFDGEVHLGAPKTDSSVEGYESSPSFFVPSPEEVPSGTTLNTVNSELPSSRPEAICSTEAQGSIMSANCSLEKQIPGEATLNVPDEEIPKSISEIASSCDGTNIFVCMKSSASKEQLPDTTACPMPAKEAPLAEPETSPSEVLEGGNVRRENDGTSPNENDQQDGVVCIVNRESKLQEPLSDLVSTDIDSLPCASSELQARCLANSEMQNASQEADISPFIGAIDETSNKSNPDATVVELTKQVQQLQSSESTSNLSPPDLPSVSAVEHPSKNDAQTSNQSSQVPSQPVANHIDGLIRQASETRTAPIPSVSNGLPLQTAPAVSSRMPEDPLKIEIERIKKEKEETTKIPEETKLQLKLECDKEIEEVVAQIRRKYEVKLKEKEAEFLLQKKELDVYSNKVLLNKKLAEAFRSKCMDNRGSGSTGAMQEANSSFLQQQQLFHLSSQQMVQQPSSTSGLLSTGSLLSMPIVSTAALNSQTMSPSLQPSTALGIPSDGSASSMQAVSPAVVNAQTMGPPLQVVNPSALFSGTPTRPPHISTISSSAGNLQIGIEVRAPAPHLRPFRPSSSVSPSSLPLHSGGMSSQQAHNNHPAAFMSLRQSYVNPLALKQASTTGQSDRTQHEIGRGSTAPPNSPLPSLDVLMGVNYPSGVNVNPPGFLLPNSSSRSAVRLPMESRVPSSRSNSAQQSGAATDIVCLSDDD